MWLHNDSEVAPKDIDEKRQQHEPGWKTTKRKLIARCLGYSVNRLSVSDDTAFRWDYKCYKCMEQM